MVKSSESCHHRGRQKSSTWEVICRVTGHHFEQSVCCSLPLSSPPPARPAPDGLEVTARVSCPKASRQLCPLQVSLLIRESVTGLKSVCVCVCAQVEVCVGMCVIDIWASSMSHTPQHHFEIRFVTCLKPSFKQCKNNKHSYLWVKMEGV